MFGEKQNQPIINGTKAPDTNPTMDDINNIPIHTMKKDLSNVNNPGLNNPEPAPQQTMAPLEITPRSEMAEKQRTSPFLSQENTPQPESQTGKTVFDTRKTETPTDPSPWGKIITIAIFIFILLIAGTGGYYFWITRQSQDQSSSSNPPVATPATEPTETKEPPAEAEPTTTPEPTLSISTDNPNPINIDIDNSDNAKIKEIINKYAEKVAASKPAKPAEFIVNDLKNNAIDFQKFASKAGMSFSPAVTANLGTKFSLFLYNDNGKVRAGISIDSKNDAALKTALLKEELNLIKEIEPLLLVKNYAAGSNTFSASSYSGIGIRYQNITSPEELSIDYAIAKNKLLIGTTKMTLRSIIDIALSSATTTSAPVVAPPATKTLPTNTQPVNNGVFVPSN